MFTQSHGGTHRGEVVALATPKRRLDDERGVYTHLCVPPAVSGISGRQTEREGEKERERERGRERQRERERERETDI